MNPAEKLRDLKNSSEKRIQAVFQLLKEQSVKGLDTLIHALLSDPSPIVRHECAYAIGELKSPEHFKTIDKGALALINAIQTDTNRFVIHEAALAVANLGEITAKKHIENLHLSEDQDIMDTAVIALERLEINSKGINIFDEHQPEDIILDHDKPMEHRIQAAFGLLSDGTEQAVDLLIKAMHTEPNPIVKHEIIFSLGETASSIVVPNLTSVIQQDPNIFVVHEAALALGTLGDKRGQKILEDLLTHSVPEIIESAEIALERLFN
ncbi:MAG: HEAT repeat domain-containing protein [Candidatus Kariarchaeaceae archaeon]|jgi:deoxyhypusine monooxygenase